MKRLLISAAVLAAAGLGSAAFAESFEDMCLRVCEEWGTQGDVGAQCSCLAGKAAGDSSVDSELRSLAVSFTLNTTYSIPLQTTVGYTSNVNRFPSVVVGRTMELNYSTVMVAGNYTFDESRFVVGSSVSPTFGDFNRLALDATGQWNVTPYMHFILQYSFFANEGSPNDDFWSLQYRYEY